MLTEDLQKTANRCAKIVPPNRLDCFNSIVNNLTGDPAYVKQSMRNWALKLKRSEKRFANMKERLASMPARHVEPDTTMENQEIVDLVDSKLTVREREILHAYRDEGLTVRELCERFNIHHEVWDAIQAKIKTIIEPYL